MPELTSNKQPGSRDDLLIEQSRCLLHRYSESSCRRCLIICPHQAISLDDALRVDPERCTGCLLCTTVCPSGALEINHQFDACLIALHKVENPVLGCCRTSEVANATLACLGGLSDEHLLYLSRQLTGRLTLNISRCSDCPNNSMLPLLLTRLENLESGGSCSINTVEKKESVQHREERVDRRNFFRSFRTSLFQTAAVVMNAGVQETERRSDYTSKRVPDRRQLLRRVLEVEDQHHKKQLEDRFVGRIVFNEACTACQACAAMCPTGALRKNREKPDSPPLFTAADCTACGLCVEFCMDQAISIL